MCGIAGFHRRGTKQVPKIGALTDNLLLEIEARGTHATGYLSLMDTGKVQLEKLPIPASQFVNRRGGIMRNARTVLLHTRFATVGSQFDPRNAHPVAAGHVAAVHNGTIYNANELFKKNGLNGARIGTVDSEIIPALVNHDGWDKAEDTLAKFRGGVATAIVDTEHPEEVILARLRGYPLAVLVTDEIVVWASTAHAIEKAWIATYGTRVPVAIRMLQEGEIIRINGTLTSTFLPESIIAAPSGRPARTQKAAPSTGRGLSAIQPPKPKKKTKARGGKGMPRAMKPAVPAAQQTLDTYVSDLMDMGLEQTHAMQVVRDAAAWRDDWDDTMSPATAAFHRLAT